MSSQANSLKSVLFALTANFTITIAKGVAAVYSGSGAMLAETIHSLADTGNQTLLLWGMKSAKRSPDDEHPLGYGKEIYFWSFIVALMLFSVGGVFSMYEGIHKLSHPAPISFPWAVLSVLLFSMVAEGISFFGCMVEVNKDRMGMSLWQWFKESRKSELLVVFGEDFAALIGLLLAATAVVLTMVTGDPVYDALGSILIGFLLIVVAALVGVEVKSLLIGQGVDNRTRRQLEQFIMDQTSVERLYNIVTLQLGNDVMVAVKVKMTEMENDNHMIDEINRIENDLKKQFPQVLWSFFEPDNRD